MPIDILDCDSFYWSKGVIIYIKNIAPKGGKKPPPDTANAKCLITVRYEGWGSLLCEELPYPNKRLAPVATYTKPIKCFVRISGMKMKEISLAERNSSDSIINWTNVWPCKIYLRTPHQNNVHASNLLRIQNTFFVQPYMTYLLPHYLAKHMTHGGQWLTADQCFSWTELAVNISSTDVNVVVHEVPKGHNKGKESYLVSNKCCQAVRVAQTDPVSIELPTSLFPKKKGCTHTIIASAVVQNMSNSSPATSKPLIKSAPSSATPALAFMKKRTTQKSSTKRKRSDPAVPVTSKVASKAPPSNPAVPDSSKVATKAPSSTVETKAPSSNPAVPVSSKVATKTLPIDRPRPKSLSVPEPAKRRESQTSATRRRLISPRSTTILRATTLSDTAPTPAPVKSASSSLPSWFEHPPFLPPPIPITDVRTYPNHCVRYLPNSNRWASVLRVSGNDIFIGAYESQAEAASVAKAALQQSRSENEHGVVDSANDLSTNVGGSVAACSKTPEMSSYTTNLLNISTESIVSAFEAAQSKKQQKQSSDSATRFTMQDWMIHHSTHNMQQLKEKVQSNEKVAIGDEFAFVVDVYGDENDHRKRRKQANPRRLAHVLLSDGENIAIDHSAGTPSEIIRLDR